MKNRALIGLSAAAMSALVVTAVGCGQPKNEPYVPEAHEEAAASATTEATTAEPEGEATPAESKAADTTDAADAKAESKAADTKAESKEADSADAKAEPKAESAAAEKETTSAAAGSYADGTYEGSAKGMGGEVPVTVTVEGGKITAVEVGENSETPGIGDKAVEQLPAKIVEAGTTEGVDAISGASITSKAILSGVDQALEAAAGGEAAPAAEDKAADTKAAEPKAESAKADADEAAPKAESKEADKAESAKAETKAADTKAAEGDLADGTYEGAGKGMGGDVPVTVTVEGGKITEVTVGDNSETQGIGTKAIEQLPAKIVEANGTEGVDAISGATITSKAIFSAIDEALSGDAAAAAPAADTKAADKAASAASEEKDASAKADKADKAESAKAETAEKSAKADTKSEAKAESKAADTKTESKEADKADSADAKAETKATDTKGAEGDLADGTYEGAGKGMGGDVPVTVTVEGGKIASVEVGDNSETQGIGTKAIEQLPAKIVEANGTEGVDAISGATITSKAIFKAVEEALASDAGAPTADAKAADKAETKAESAKDDKAATSTKAADKAEESEEADAKAASKETESKTSAKAETKKADTKAESKKVDTKASTSAKADKASSSKADASASAGELKDGTYEGAGKGMGGDVPVTVTVSGGKITEVAVGDNSETQGIGTKAIEQLPAKIVEANGTEGVDAISGATITSKAIFKAVEEALA